MKSQEKTPFVYQIRVEGDLGDMWAGWFEGLKMKKEVHIKDNLTITELPGPIKDQPALFGVLNKIRDLNLTLISIIRKQEGDGRE